MMKDAPTSHFISAPDGLRLHAREYGLRSAPSLPVVCLPGLARSGNDFDALAIALSGDAARPRRVVALDYRGRGLSAYDPNPAKYNFQVEIADVLAVLQRMGRNPPPAILVKPQDMREAVRAAMVLGATVSDVKAETDALARDFERMNAVKAEIAKQRDDLARTAQSLALDKIRLNDLIDARRDSLATAENALAAERKRAQELAAQALSLKDLIAKMEAEVGSAKAGAQAARDADQAAAADVTNRAASMRGADPARLKPAIAFADAKGQLSLPVVGAVVKTYGASDGFGGAEKGVSISTPPAATVSTPIDAWVVYAGPYRSYGQLLILNAGGGYYMVLAGMDRIQVSVGQFVLAGEPVAVMGDGSARTAAAAAIGAAQPVLYIELRRNEAAIDPGPWWAKTNIEKARG